MMNKNKSLILKTDTQVSLRKASSLLTITDKILQRYNSKLFEILMNNPKAAVTLLYRFYPFDGDLIDKCGDVLDFNVLAGSIYVRWNIALTLIEKYKDKWDWKWLSTNKSLPWSDVLIEKYKDKWNWTYLSGNKSLPWSESFIEKYKDMWNWEWLSRNESLPWSDVLIEKYKDKWNWEWLSRNESLPWSDVLIEKYKDKWDWRKLSTNESLPWSESFIEKYKDMWNWERILSANKHL